VWLYACINVQCDANGKLLPEGQQQLHLIGGICGTACVCSCLLICVWPLSVILRELLVVLCCLETQLQSVSMHEFEIHTIAHVL
jgi:hypothetical protein